MLTHCAEDQAQRLGFSSVQLDTPSTGGAVPFYTQIGFEAITETRILLSPASETVPSHIRIVKPIQAESSR